MIEVYERETGDLEVATGSRLCRKFRTMKDAKVHFTCNLVSNSVLVTSHKTVPIIIDNAADLNVVPSKLVKQNNLSTTKVNTTVKKISGAVTIDRTVSFYLHGIHFQACVSDSIDKIVL